MLKSRIGELPAAHLGLDRAVMILECWSVRWTIYFSVPGGPAGARVQRSEQAGWVVAEQFVLVGDPPVASRDLKNGNQVLYLRPTERGGGHDLTWVRSAKRVRDELPASVVPCVLALAILEAHVLDVQPRLPVGERLLVVAESVDFGASRG